MLSVSLKASVLSGCVLLAMLADVADEALVVTRAFDKEVVDIASRQSAMQSFLEQIEMLFGQRAVCFTLP
eukprot:4045326-Lingulodinium_polyedra.AAC.1